MTDANFASLSPRLLARKGGAKPAMRSQLGSLGSAASLATADLDDLGWNDLGDDGGTPAASVVQSADIIAIDASRARIAASRPVSDQTAEGPATVSPATKPGSRAQAAGARNDRSAFTLRLDPDRHLKLRLACTVRHCSAQQLVTDALDALLADMPDILKLATQVGRT